MARSEPGGEHLVEVRRKLREHIDRVTASEKSPGSIPKFCRMHGWDENMRIEIQRVIDGTRKRISGQFASRIQDATGGPEGEFPVSVWYAADESGSLPAVDAGQTG